MRALVPVIALAVPVLAAVMAGAAVSGTADLDRLHYALNEVPVVTVTDADLNTSPTTKQTVSVTLTSTSDTAGISVALRESDVDSGVFSDPTEGIEFTTGASNDVTNTLKVAAGDTVTLRYSDASPAQLVEDTATMYADTATTAFDGAVYALPSAPEITVTDADRNTSTTTQQSFDVTVTSSEDATGVTLTLTETSANASTFSGTLALEDDGGASSVGLEVNAGDTLTATYVEPLFDGSSTANRTATAQMGRDGSLTLDARRYSNNANVVVTVGDDDENEDALVAETVSVVCIDPNDSMNLTLTETGVSTGVFEQSMTLSTSLPTDRTLRVLNVDDGDAITCTYHEAGAYSQSGTVARVGEATVMIDDATVALDASRYPRSDTATITVVDVDLNQDATAAETLTVSATSTEDAVGLSSITLTETGVDTSTFTGSLTFEDDGGTSASGLEVNAGDTVTVLYEEPESDGAGTTNRTTTATMFTDESATPTLSAYRYRFSHVPGLEVSEPDADTSANADTVSVALTSTTDPAGITVVLTESGPSTGVFDVLDATVSFTASGSSDDATNTLRASEGDTITLTYLEQGYGGGSTARTDVATMYVDGASATLADDSYALGAIALRVDDVDENANPGSLDQFTVTLAADGSDSITVILTETGFNTDVFTGTATLVSGATDDTTDELHVDGGDPLTLTHTEDNAAGTGTIDRTDTARVRADGSASLDAGRYRLADTATIDVSDADLDISSSPDTVAVTLSSTTDATGITVTLTETGASTGDFTGSATFRTTASSGSSLQVAAGDAVTLTYSETTTYDGVDTDRTDDATMYADTATIAFVGSIACYDLADTETIRVVDEDANLDASAVETVSATITSGTDATGLVVTLTETGEDTGTFEGSFGFESDGGGSGSGLEVVSGDTFSAAYAEPAFAGGTTTRTTATLSMCTDGQSVFEFQRYNGAQNPTATVTDPDANADAATAETLTISADSTSGDPVNVTLTETGANTGVFTGSFDIDLTIPVSDTVTPILAVDPGDTLTGTYAETTTFSGTNANRVAVATVFADTATAGTTWRRYDLADEAVVRVVDADINRDATVAETIASVTVTSTSDPTGITLGLTETGVDTDTFDGTITFTTNSSSGTALQVAAGDTVTVSYAEPEADGAGTTTRTGTAQMFSNGASVAFGADRYSVNEPATVNVTDDDRNQDPSIAETVSATVTSSSDATGVTITLTETGANTAVFSGAASLTTGPHSSTHVHVGEGDVLTATYDEPTFEGGTSAVTGHSEMRLNGSALLDGVTSGGRYDLTDTAAVTIEDTDLNSDPTVQETVTVSVASDTDTTGISLVCTELANSSSVFTTCPVTFGTEPSDDAADRLQVSGGDTVTLTYAEDTTFEGPAANRTATATMRVDGTTSLDAARYALDDEATLQVTDADLDTGPGQQTVPVTLRSTTDGTGISVTLTETGGTTGVFEAPASFTGSGTSDDASDVLRVSSGDAVTLVYAETTTLSGTAAERSDTATIATNGSASLDAQVYDLADTAALSVTDPDLDADPSNADTVSVAFESQTDAAGIAVTLTETGASTGVFTGSATFTGSGSSDDASDVLRVSDADALTLTYTETTTLEGPNADRTASARMATDGAVTIAQRYYGVDDTATLRVTDRDLDTDGESAQTVSVGFSSTTDGTGISVTLTETGNATGVFEGTATFTASGSSDDAADILLVAAGDALTASYAETTTFSGSGATRTAAATMRSDAASATLSPTLIDTADTATLSVADTDADADAGAPDTVVASLTSTTDGTGISVTLTETGDTTGVFEGPATFTASGSSNDASDVLRVSGGDEVTLSYDEPLFAGSTAARTDASDVASDGSVGLDASGYDTADTATITVVDADLDDDSASAETVAVALTSATDGTGISVTLTETGVATATFTGTATFVGTGASDDASDILRISQGDAITASYEDADPLAGGTSTRTDSARAATDGTAAFDADDYAADDEATLTVTDPDLDADDAAADVATVALTSDTDATGISVVLTETGVATGVFTGTATFAGTGSSDDAGDVLRVSAGDDVTLRYAETTTFAGTAAERTDGAQMRLDGAVALDGTLYDLADTATITVTDGDLDEDPAAADTVSATLRSTTDTAGIGVVLTETGASTGEFTGAATFVGTGASDDDADELLVSAGDTVTTVYADATSFSGTAEERTDTARVTVDGVAALDAARYRLSGAPALSVTDADLDTTAAPDVVVVTARSGVDTTGVTVTLTETGGSTGIFSGTIALTTGPASDDTADVLRIRPGDDVTLEYDEQTTFDGTSAARTDTASVDQLVDFDGDGWADLAFGVPYEDVDGTSNAGAVNVIYGSATGAASSGDELLVQAGSANEAGDHFGEVLATGDFDGDGFTDLAVGVPDENVGSAKDAGAVVVRYGSAAGLGAGSTETWTQDTPGIEETSEARDLFGAALATGDVNGDGYDDLVVGIPGESFGSVSDGGAIEVIYGGAGGLSATGDRVMTQDSAGVGEAAHDGDRFGSAVAVGDIDADGLADVVVGVPGEDVRGDADAGAINVLRGGAGGVTVVGDEVWTQDSSGIAGASQPGDGFGSALAVGDLDGDGFLDVVVGVPGEDVGGDANAGAVNVLYGSSGLLSARDRYVHQDSSGVTDDAEAGERFGSALRLADLDGDGRADLAVGVPNEDVGGDADAGAVHVLRGSAGGLTVSGDVLWTQDSPGVLGASGAYDRFGSALGAADLDDDGAMELLVGVPREDPDGVTNAGGVAVLYGSSAGTTAAGDQLWHQGVPGIADFNESWDRQGSAIAS